MFQLNHQRAQFFICLTNTFSSSGAGLKPVIALAAVASHSVDAAPVLTDARLGAALIQICQCTEQKNGRMKKVRRRKNSVRATYCM